tara:strand:+ start:4223 stop:4630 length:408 start_codon:yes stop_codon:yes gene_type:complete
MSNWGIGYEKYKITCKDERKCKMQKTKKTRNTVDALVLHNKMPYIWRFLKPQTRKLMIELANKPLKKINIPFHIFPDLNNKNKNENKNKNKNENKNKNKNKNENKNKMTARKMGNNMTQKNRKLFHKLRKKYKNI